MAGAAMFDHFPFLRHGNWAADAPVLADDDNPQWISAGQLAEQAQGWAHKLAGPRSLVFLNAQNQVQCVAAMLGAMQAGHVLALLDPELPAASQTSLAKSYRPGFVIEACGNVQRHASGSVDLHPHLSLLLSTSGSTGSPKFVRLSCSALDHNALAIGDALDIRAGEVGCGHLALHYSYGLSVLTSHLAAGAPVRLTQYGFLDPQFWQEMKQAHIAHLPGVPFHYQMLHRLRFERLQLPHLRVMTQAGGALDAGIASKAHAFMAGRNGRFHIMYGQTEAAPRITTLPHDDFAKNAHSVGPALKGGQIAVEGADGQQLPAGQQGEVVYHGPNVMLGYAQCAADLALGDINRGRLETGDLGILDAAGRLTITGRSQRVGKIAGLRVNLDEVEQLLAAKLGELAVVQEGDALMVHHTSAQGNETMRHTAQQILAERSTLPPSAIRINALQSLPYTSRGKVDYAALALHKEAQPA